MKKRLCSLLLALTLLLALFPASAGAEMTVSDGLVTYIKTFEGFRSKVYNDGTGWYIGYGCACGQYDYPNGITEAQADALLRSKMNAFSGAVNRFLSRYGVTVTQGQFDALCGLSYNIGTAWLNAANRLPSMLIDGVEHHTEQEIASALGAYCHVSGKVSEYHIRRRIMELKMFLYDDYSYTFDGWNWLILDANGGENEFSDVAVYKAGEPYRALPAVTRGGWYFAGWRTAEGKTLRAADTVSENYRVTAQWSETPATVSGTFWDVPDDVWYYDDVEMLTAQGVVSGYGDGAFHPEAPVTWGAALKLVLLSAGFPEQTAPEDAHWAQGYLDYAIAEGYVAEDAEIALDAAITRDGIADLCAAALELGGMEIGGEGSPFADSERGSVLALYDAGILMGSVAADGNRYYRGGDPILRAEICAVMVRMADYVERNFVFVSGYRAAINFDLPMNPYDMTAFRSSGGRVYYDGAAETVQYGVDVSYYQKVIDWKQVAADGIDFAIIRCGYRGRSAGKIVEDEQFRANISGALAVGLDVGVYFFSQALNAAEAVEEAKYTLELIKGYNVTYPVIFDWEPQYVSGSRTNRPDWTAVTDAAVAFCDTVAAAGYTPMVYFYVHMAYLQLELPRIQEYDAWVASYNTAPKYIYDFKMWQYGSTGRVAGIPGDVDMDICFVNYG